MSKKRLAKDFKYLLKNKIKGIEASPTSDLYNWQAILLGPEDSVYAGGIFKLKITFKDSYPNEAPNVVFITKMFHPNIYNDGRICLDILAKNWSPVYNVSSILLSIQSLLLDPNIKSPANIQPAKLYINNRREYNKKIKNLINETLYNEI